MIINSSDLQAENSNMMELPIIHKRFLASNCIGLENITQMNSSVQFTEKAVDNSQSKIIFDRPLYVDPKQ